MAKVENITIEMFQERLNVRAELVFPTARISYNRFFKYTDYATINAMVDAVKQDMRNIYEGIEQKVSDINNYQGASYNW